MHEPMNIKFFLISLTVMIFDVIYLTTIG